MRGEACQEPGGAGHKRSCRQMSLERKRQMAPPSRREKGGRAGEYYRGGGVHGLKKHEELVDELLSERCC